MVKFTNEKMNKLYNLLKKLFGDKVDYQLPENATEEDEWIILDVALFSNFDCTPRGFDVVWINSKNIKMFLDEETFSMF